MKQKYRPGDKRFKSTEIRPIGPAGLEIFLTEEQLAKINKGQKVSLKITGMTAIETIVVQLRRDLTVEKVQSQTYVVMIGKHYLYEVAGVTEFVTGADPDKAKVYKHRDRAENVAHLTNGKVVERL